MQITCPNCNNVCEVEEEPAIGQHLLCPLCDTKFSYSPQIEDGVNADGIGETTACATYGHESIAEPPSKDEPAATTPGNKRGKAILAKARSTANATKVKTVALWQSGKKWKVVISGIVAFLAICLSVPFLLPNRNADTDYEMGLRYLNGDGVAKDMVMAADLFRRAAGQGHAEAQHQLGLIHGSLQDWQEAAKWYHMAAEQGLPKAKLALGFCYSFGLGVSKDEAKANRLLNEAKQDPSLQKQIQEFVSLFRYTNVNDAGKDEPQGVESLRCAAEQGNVEAQCKLGVCYSNGDGVEKNDGEAAKWFRKAAEQGNVEAQGVLGISYYNGIGVAKNYKEAAKWFRMAAEQSDADAQYRLGMCYSKGEGVEKSDKEAVTWFRKAAEQGHAEAESSLALCYYDGMGVSKNDSEALKWFHRAAEQGHAGAQCMLGICYSKGDGVGINNKEAVKWFRKAAEQGHAESQCVLGIFYYNGVGVAKNDREAIKWLRMSAEQGCLKAKISLDEIERAANLQQFWGRY